MKFWELVSVCRERPNILDQVILAEKWPEFYEWYSNYNSLVREQDRKKLDTVIPDALAEEVLSKIPEVLYRSGDHLCSYPLGENSEVSYLEVYHKFGGSIIEEVLEKGSAKIESE